MLHNFCKYSVLSQKLFHKTLPSNRKIVEMSIRLEAVCLFNLSVKGLNLKLSCYIPTTFSHQSISQL